MPDPYPPYIFGMHDRGGESLMMNKGKHGWVLVTEAIGADPNNRNGSNYTDLTNKNLGVIVRLNNGYGSGGTIPRSGEYANFARRCGNFVQASPGCRIWIIGNEMNLAAERPGGPNGQAITPKLYATCYRKCRAEIRRRPGHAKDLIVVGAVGPWNTQTRYAGNQRGDWVRYFADILKLLGDDVDGIALHTYTHGQDPGLVFSNDKMNAPFQKYHYHFRAYRDFMAAIPYSLYDRPIFITETDQYGAWRDGSTGWVRNAYKEIADWNHNAENQPIQSLILYRWIIGNPDDAREVGWAIVNKGGVQDDFRQAMNSEYRLVLPPTKPPYKAAWVEVTAPGRMDRNDQASFRVRVRNDGRATWANTGTKAVRLRYRWIDAAGAAVVGARTSFASPVAPGKTATLPAVTVKAPDKPGNYTLELDLVKGTSDWFAKRGSPTSRRQVRVGDRYRAAWLSVAAPSEGSMGETVTCRVRVRNEGSLTWVPTGNHPVHLTYKWLDADRTVVVADGLRTSLGKKVAPLQEISLNAKIQFPAKAGSYILQMDMVEEFVTWFQWKGSPVYEAQVAVAVVQSDYGAEWLVYEGPDHLVVGERATSLVQVKNVGTLPWHESGEQAIKLGHRWLDAQGDEVAVAGAAAALPGTIQPGETATFRDLAIVAPETAGAYRLVLDLMQGERWLSALGVAVMEQPIQIRLPEYGVQWQALREWPATMPPGAQVTTGFRLTNTGTATWNAGDYPVHLAYHWFTPDGNLAEPWETFRISLPGNVASGQAAELTKVPFKTPPTAGTYVLRWDLVEEGNIWFFRQGGAPLEIDVEVADQAVLEQWTAEANVSAENASLAFDAGPGAAWDSGAVQKPGMWFQVDLGRVLVLDRVAIASPERGFPAGYQVTLSEDGNVWHLVAEEAKNWRDIDAAFAPCRARYVRIEQTGVPPWAASWKISGVAVSATEPWAGASASHYAKDAGEAIDADLRTAWSTRGVKQKPGMWFELDMGSPREIERLVLENPVNQQPRGYRVRVSTDRQKWQEVGRKDDNWGRLDVEFPPATARYLRVETTNSSRYHPWGIANLAVWRSLPQWLRGKAE
jgi:hypothetical protein